MIEALMKRWPLLLVLIAFIIMKVPAVHYPFYWDESWSYAPGVQLMYQHGPSLMPNAIDISFSRGHPLLFYAAAATWMKIFGSSHTAQHTFSLFISCLLLISIYEIMLRLYNKRSAILALLLVTVQVIFFVQSTMLLPEVMVAWLALLTLYYYATQQYVLTVISCTALMLTKESGMTAGLVIGLHALWYLFANDVPAHKKLKNLASVIVPGILIGIFFVVQKKLNGWYLYPEHTSLIDMSWEMFKGKLRFCIEIVFTHQYRAWQFAIPAVLSIIAAVYKRNVKLALPAFLGILLYILGGEVFGFITRRIFIPFVLGVYIYTFYELMKAAKTGDNGRRFIYVAMLFTAAYLSFTCLNFFTNRYLLAVLVILLILAAWATDMLLGYIKPVYFNLVLVAVFVPAAYAYTHSKGQGDVDMGIYGAMSVQEDVVNYLERQNAYSDTISAYSALARVHLTQPNTGFLHSTQIFKTVIYNIQPSTRYLLIDNIEPDTAFRASTISNQFYRVYRTQHGESWAEIYKRK